MVAFMGKSMPKKWHDCNQAGVMSTIVAYNAHPA
jgi:hypothetical protein